MNEARAPVRVLVVTFVQSIHAVRAVEPMVKLGWDVHVFPSNPHWAHPGWHDVTLHHDPGFDRPQPDPSVRVERLEPPAGDTEPVVDGLSWRQRAGALAALIRELKPQLVDSMEIQHGGYLTLEARQLLGGEFPPWVVHNWGSDVYYYGRNARHVSRLRDVLSACDYYGAECHRDVGLARAFGFAGRVLPVLPNTGGFDLEQTRSLRQPGATSQRRGIALKATQSFVYRPDTAVEALEQCADLLDGYRLCLYTASPDIQDRARRLCERSGMELDVVSTIEAIAPHEEVLAMHGRSRISISLSMSDAVCTSFLEAMVMGSFPVQSNTGCSAAWADAGRGALFVDPESPEEVAEALRRALSDDGLVDAAATANAAVASASLDQRILLERAMDVYERVAAEVALGRTGTGRNGIDHEAMTARLLEMTGSCGCSGLSSAVRRQVLALRYSDGGGAGQGWADLLPADAAKEDWAALAEDLAWVLERQAEQEWGRSVDWARGEVAPDERIHDWHDSDLVERDLHIAALRQHVKALQQSLDGFHRDLEASAAAEAPPSSRGRPIRRLLPARARRWARVQASRARRFSAAARDRARQRGRDSDRAPSPPLVSILVAASGEDPGVDAQHYSNVETVRLGGGSPDQVFEGVERAAGELVMYLGPGDTLLPNAVGRLAAVMAESPDVAAVYPAFRLVDGEGAAVETVVPEELDLGAMLTFQLAPTGPAPMFRRDAALAAARLQQAPARLEGLSFWLNVAAAGDVRRIAEPLACRRIDSIHRMRPGGVEAAKERLADFERIVAQLEPPAELRNAVTSGARSACILAALELGSNLNGAQERFAVVDRFGDGRDASAGGDLDAEVAELKARAVNLEQRLGRHQAAISVLEAAIAGSEKRLAEGSR